MEAFELRLWDGRLGRWQSPDPAHQYASPYLGMGNNPVTRTDPDGGMDGCDGCPDKAKPGDVFNHPEYGKITYGGGGWIDSNGAGILDAVVITGKMPDSYSDSFRKMSVGVLGMANAFASNIMWGAGRNNHPENFGQDELSFRVGQLAGDVMGMVAGNMEMMSGLGIMTGSVVLAPETIGVSLPGVVAGGAVFVHGGGVTIISTGNTIGSIKGIADYMSSRNHSSGGGGGGDNYKKVSSNKDADNYAKSKGYKDAHDLKEAHDVGSKFDIFVDSKTGQGVLRSKDQKIEIPIH